MMEPIIIDLRSHSNDSAYRARVLWEKLFRLTHAENWRSLQDFLCDLKIFTYKFDHVYKREDFKLVFYWDYDTNGQTNVNHDNPYYEPDENTYKITIDYSNSPDHKIIVEKC